MAIADNLTLDREFLGPRARRLVESTFESSRRAGVEHRLCTQFQAAKSCSIPIAMLLERSRAAKHRTSESNRSDFALTQSTCQPIGVLTPSLTVSTPRFSPGCAAGSTIGRKSGISKRREILGGSMG